MAERELRIRAIADVSQAKAALQSLSGEQVKQQAAATASDAAAKRQAADLAKLQLEQAKATGAGAEAVKKLGQEFKAAAAEAKVAAAEAKVLARAASEVRVQERNQAFAVRQAERQARAAAVPVADREAVRAEKFALKRAGLLPEGLMDEKGAVSGGAVAGGLAAAITAAIMAGFASIGNDQRSAQKKAADKASSLVDQMDEITKKGRENGMSDADIGKLLNAIQTMPGVADSSTLARAALAKVSEGDTQGALGAVLKTAQGEAPVTEVQAAEHAKRRGLRDIERAAAVNDIKSINDNAEEERAKAIRSDMEARGAQTALGKGLSFAMTDIYKGVGAGDVLDYLASGVGLNPGLSGEKGRLKALDFGNQVSTRGALTATLEAATGTRDKGGSRFDPIFVESNQPRRLGGD